nr:hypothetical protein [Tanacetum cinerariifolium]
MFMANLSSADPITDEARPSYDSDILSEVQDHDQYLDDTCAYQEEHVMHDSVQLDHVVDLHADYMSVSNMILYDQYVKDNKVPVVHSNASSVPNDTFMMIYNDMCEPSALSVSNTSRNAAVKTSLTTELATYREQVELYKRRANHWLQEPFVPYRAKQAQPALYNGHEILEENHAPTKVHNTEDTLEIAEITRKKMNAKMTDPECVTHKVKIAPHDYSRENLLATFTSQKQLTPEQIYWSNDLMKLKSEALKERAKVSRPIKAFTVITPTGLTDRERGFEKTKAFYLQEVIQFFKTIKDNFKGIQKALTKEVKEMKDVFEELEAEVAQCAVDRKHDAIDQKKLLIANDNLIAECLSKKVFSVATNSELNVTQLAKMHIANTFVEARCLALEAELATLRDKSHQENQGELIKHFSKLETIDSQITKLTDHVTHHQAQNDMFRAENDKIKQHYKDLYDSIKITHAKHIKQHSQELLEYTIGTCPQGSQQRAKKLAHIPLIRKKKVIVAKPSDKSDSTTRRHVVTVKFQKTNVPVPPSTGVNSCPNASGSQPKSHVKANRISPAKDKMADVNAPSGQTPTMAPPAPTTTDITTTTTTLPPPQAPQQSMTEAMMVKCIGELEHIMADLIQVNKDMEERLDSHGSRLHTLEQLDIPQRVSIFISEVVTDAVDWAMQAPLRNCFRDLPEADMKEILHQRMWEFDSYKSDEDHMQLFEALEKSLNRDHYEELAQELAEARKKKKKSHELPKMPPGSPSHQPPPPPPPAGPSRALGAPRASGSAQMPPSPPPPSSTNQESPSKGSVAPSPSKIAVSAEYQAWTTTNITQSSNDEDIESAHIPTVNLRQGWWKPFEEERPTTPKPTWSIRSSDVPVPMNNWASALASNYSPPPEDSLLAQTGDIATFMDWFCKRRGITELKPQDLEGPAYEIVKVFHPNVIHLQYQMEECHKLLTDSVNDPILRHNISRPLPLGGPPGQVTIQSDFFFNKDLEYLRYEQMVPDQFWIEEECKYDIAAMYGISHWWFQRQRFYIDRNTSEGDRSAVRTHIRILSVVRIEVFSMYGYDYMKKIVLRHANLNEHVIAERDFKYLYLSDFEDLYLLNLQEDLQLRIECYQTQVNLTKPQWTATGFEYKHDYRAVIFRDKYRVQMMMRLNEIHKFSDGTLQQIDKALDYRVKEFRINRMNPGLNTRFWTRLDVDWCNAFIFAIQWRLKTRRIFRNLESFVGGRVREGDYRVLSKDGNPARANIKQALVGFNSLVHSLRALSALRRSGLRTASTAAKPCQGDSSEFYLITGSIHTDQ